MLALTDAQAFDLAQQARERFAGELVRALPQWAQACLLHLEVLIDQPRPPPEVQLRRDTWAAFRQRHPAWVSQCRRALQALLAQRPAEALQAGPGTHGAGRLELLGDEVVEDQIMVSRLAMRVLDTCASELNELRLRMQYLEKRQALPADDLLLPEVVARTLVEQWLAVPLAREGWNLVHEALAPLMAKHLLQGYHAANAFLISRDVMREIDLHALVRRSQGAPAVSGLPVGRAPGGVDDSGGGMARVGGMGHGRRAGGLGVGPAGNGRDETVWGHHSSGWGDSSGSGDGWLTVTGSSRARSGAGTDLGGRVGGVAPGESASPVRSAWAAAVQDETQLLTGSTPLARARMRAQGVLGNLKRLLTHQVGEGFEATRATTPVTPPLSQALAQGADAAMVPTLSGGLVDAGHVDQAATALRQRMASLKAAASTPTEKATIEVVALMFQSILAEERLPAAMRLWFARLQIPVLRVALAEPGFFSALEHPARRLIDRMGSCVMGFEADVGSAALEAEIRRVVEVIEQYPETGRRVFQLVYDEFEAFLANWLSEQGPASRLVPVAQQLELKETMAVQYTIELRKLLDDMPVRDEIRDFLFKVWVDVLALASVKHGRQHEQTQALKRVASELLWAASAKPDRSERARVIQQLPGLLQRLRQGMSLLGYPPDRQEAHLQAVSNTLTDAFMSRTEVIPQASLDLLAQRLAQLEDYLPEGGVGDLELDNESIELLTGLDASNIEVIRDGGSQPNEAMRAWAAELQMGAWFGLDHNGHLHNVQLAWRSQHGQLYLFVSGQGRCHLIQAHRVAAYLQAGLLVPSEDEALTVRATRAALAKLDANPERLLA